MIVLTDSMPDGSLFLFFYSLLHKHKLHFCFFYKFY